MIYYSSDNLKIVYCIRNPFYALFKNKRLFTLRANKFRNGNLVLFYKNYTPTVLLISFNKFLNIITNEKY